MEHIHSKKLTYVSPALIAFIMLGIVSFAHQATDTDREKVASCGALFGGFVMLVVSSNKPLARRQ